jgi:hypothetical protein
LFRYLLFIITLEYYYYSNELISMDPSLVVARK